MQIIQWHRRFYRVEESGLREPIDLTGRRYQLLGYAGYTFQVYNLASGDRFLIRINYGKKRLVTSAQVGPRREWSYTLQPDQPIDPLGSLVMPTFEERQVYWHQAGEYFSTGDYPRLNGSVGYWPRETTMRSDGEIDSRVETVEATGLKYRHFGVTGATWACLFTAEGLPFELHVWQDADPAVLGDLIVEMRRT